MADVIPVRVKRLTKRFADLTVLDDVSFEVKKGENLVVFGRSGTGKSVLLKCAVGLIKPDKGDVFLLGKNIFKIKTKELNEVRKKIGFLFQGAALYDSMSVRENLAFPLVRNFNFSESEIEEKILRVLEMVKLTEAIDKMPAELSGGMKKRIGLARGIITEPEIMFYDEPTTGLDPLTSKEISILIRDLQHQLNMTSIVVTHDLICAEIIADRAIFLKDGKIKYEGTVPDLINSEDAFLNNFFNKETTNV